MKYEKQFRKDHPETIGEADSEFDKANYIEWLEQRQGVVPHDTVVINDAFVELFDSASCIQHWHDTMYNEETDKCEGMVVSSEKVRELWTIVEKHRRLRHSL